MLDHAQFTGQPLPGTGWIAGLGPAGSEVSVIDQDGARLPDGTLGEIAGVLAVRGHGISRR